MVSRPSHVVLKEVRFAPKASEMSVDGSYKGNLRSSDERNLSIDNPNELPAIMALAAINSRITTGRDKESVYYNNQLRSLGQEPNWISLSAVYQ